MVEPTRRSIEAAGVERDLAAYYDAEAADRADRALDPERVARRGELCTRFARSRPILEVGTGPGRDATAFVDAGFHVVGVDLSTEHARRTARTGAAVAVASVRALPFRTGSFGGAWTMSTLMHVPRTAIGTALGEIRRVLAPDGLLAVGVWGGADSEHLVDGGRYGPPRLFSRRTDERWRELLATHVGPVVEWDTWHRGDDDFWYQWAVVQRR